MHKCEKLTLFAYGAVLTAALGGYLMGFHAAVISGALGLLEQTFSLNAWSMGAIVSLLLLGACAGSTFAGYFSDRFGRRWALMGAASFYTIGAGITALALDLSMLLAGRFLTGIGVGVASLATPLYLAEISPPPQRGTMVFINSLSGTIGILTTYVINFIFFETGDWRAMFAVGLIPSLLLMSSMFFFPETPMWLLNNHKKEQAKLALKKLRRDRLWEKHLSEIKECIAVTKTISWRRLLHPTVKFALFVGVMLSIFQQITGINAVIYFSPEIFKQAGYGSGSTALLGTIGIGGINVIGTLIGLKLIDRAGRRPLGLVGMGGMILSLLVLSATFIFDFSYSGPLAVASLIIYVGFFASALSTIPWLINAEIYPLSIRGQAMSIATFANWFCNFLVAQTFLLLIEVLGSSGVFLLFMVFALIAFYFIYRYVPETKGKSLEEIESHLAEMRIKH